MKLYRARFARSTIGGSVLVENEDFYLPDETAVRRSLRARGLWPIKIYEQKPPLFEWMDVRSREWQFQLLRAIRFQSATASAGTAFMNIIEGEEDPRRRLAFLPSRTVLKGGGSFSEALKELKLFDAPTMAIIMAGERAGDLKGVIQHAIEHVEQKGAQYKLVVAALSWISFDIFAVISTIWGVQFWFIPLLREQGVKSTDPAAVEKFQRGIQMVSWLNGTMLFASTVMVLGIVFFVWAYWRNRHRRDHYTARMMTWVPLLANYLRNVSFKDTCKLMARLIRGKVPLAEALEIIIESSVEPVARLYWSECEGKLMAGVEPARALARAPLTKAERDQILTIQSVEQLAEVFDSISEERSLMAKTDQRKIIKFGLYLLIGLSAITILTTIYLLMLQNEGFLSNINEMRG
ncbi:MAG: type II secretion system F family protein [Alphaproteobacteria bacterium]|nr:type II secretion system F family protein [Alphaproteobacteria bacterium]